MSETFIFSVVIPTYNTGKIICETLDSLVEQSYKNFEVIVIDDGSKDDTLSYVQQYRSKLNLQIFPYLNWGGPARPRNLGIMHSTAEWIAFLDHDDIWDKDKLKNVIDLLENNDVIFHDLQIFNHKMKTRIKLKGRNLYPDPFISLMIYGNVIANSSAVVRKSILEKVNYIDESRELLAAEDYDLWLKISKQTSRFCYVNKTLGGYRLEPGQNMTAASNNQIARYEFVINKYIGFLSEENQKKAQGILSYSNARIHHKLARYENAKKEYMEAFKSIRFEIKLKALIGLVQLLFKKP